MKHTMHNVKRVHVNWGSVIAIIYRVLVRGNVAYIPSLSKSGRLTRSSASADSQNDAYVAAVACKGCSALYWADAEVSGCAIAL